MMAAASAPSPFYPLIQSQLGLPAIAITVVFAVYAVALLAALLVAGSLSDHVGRRPVTTAAFLALAISIIMFWQADSEVTLVAARAIQGAASGVLMSTLSATVTDFASPMNSKAAALTNALTPMFGLAFGALLAGTALAVDETGAETTVFLTLAVSYVFFAVANWTAPESSARREGWAASLRPRVSVPAAARRLFGISIPVIIAGWATGGLFLSLGASIVHDQLHIEDRLVQAMVIALLPAAGALGVFILRNRSPRTLTIYGGAALSSGTALSLVGLTAELFPLYLAAVAVSGTGFGTAFMGVIGSLAPTVAPHERAGLFAALYTVCYLAFGIPAVIAGLLATTIGLVSTTLYYGIAVAAATAALLRARQHV